MSKYQVNAEEDWEPGSNEKVLRNSLGIKSSDEMADQETELLYELYQSLFISDELSSGATLSMATICEWHKRWLSPVYPWAGNYRSVNMSKPDMDFTIAKRIPNLATTFEVDYLAQCDELASMPEGNLITYLAKCHIEFILIHPFREGNGRISRLLMDVQSQMAGFGPLDYSLWDEHKEFYFKAIQAGRDGDSQHVERLVRDILPTDES